MDRWVFAGMGYSEEEDEDDDDDDEDYGSGDECEEDEERREQVPVSTFCGLRRNFLIEPRELPGGGSSTGLTHTQVLAGPVTGSAEVCTSGIGGERDSVSQGSGEGAAGGGGAGWRDQGDGKAGLRGVGR
uniref:Uncharacterized protein n=1 Tax=Callorhinchus milii TaxID=7868 RepID=A0A4W3GKQ5_CALMI